MIRVLSIHLLFLILVKQSSAQDLRPVLLKPDRVFDGENIHTGWQVLVDSGIIKYAGPATQINIPAGTQTIDLKGKTLIPGLIEGHSHIFLHPYNEVKWNNQVLGESRAERTARAVNHLREALMAGFTTYRDLGTEGMWYDDAGLKTAIDKGLIPGPRLLVATRAIVATGSYAPKMPVTELQVPKGAAEADGEEGLIREARTQIGNGADLIKVYADFSWGVESAQRPTFTQHELNRLVETVSSSGRFTVAHASTPEGMERAVLAGVRTIEHGDNGTRDVFRLMKQKNTGYCATLAAGEAYEEYEGWVKGKGPDPAPVREKKTSFRIALEEGVKICMGGDVGVYAHGTNAREMELMVEYGMKPLDVLRSATSINAELFGISHQVGSIRRGLLADLVAVDGEPDKDIRQVRKVGMVMKGGRIYR